MKSIAFLRIIRGNMNVVLSVLVGGSQITLYYELIIVRYLTFFVCDATTFIFVLNVSESEVANQGKVCAKSQYFGGAKTLNKS